MSNFSQHLFPFKILVDQEWEKENYPAEFFWYSYT